MSGIKFVRMALALSSVVMLPGMASNAIAAAAANSESPVNFLQRVFSRYRQLDPQRNPDMPWRGFTDQILAHLIDRDRELYGLQGDIGLLDSDPICNCQDVDPKEKIEIDGYFLKSGEYLARLQHTGSGFSQMPWLLLLKKTSAGWLIIDRPDFDGDKSLAQALTVDVNRCEIARRYHPDSKEPC